MRQLILCFALFLFITNPILALVQDGLDLVQQNPYQLKLKEVKAQLAREEKQDSSSAQNDGYKKLAAKGVNDPHYPARMKTNPAFKIPADLDTLPTEELSKLMADLGKVPLKIKWYDKKGDLRSGRKHLAHTIRTSRSDKASAAAAVALHTAIQKDFALLTKVIVAAPDPIMFALHGELGSIMDVKVAAEVLTQMVAKIGSDARQVASSCANVVQVYIDYWSEKDPELQTWALSSLIMETSNKIVPLNFSIKQKGILLGALLAGTLIHAQNIKSKDEQKLWTINSISNLVWAASTFMGIFPLVGSTAAALAGTLSVAIVLWAVVNNKIGVRDYTPRIREIEGHIEFSALEYAEGKDSQVLVDMMAMLAWMRASIHINGLFD